jgi:hypothetical protein
LLLKSCSHRFSYVDSFPTLSILAEQAVTLPYPGIVNKQKVLLGLVNGDPCVHSTGTAPGAIVDANISSGNESAGHLQVVGVLHAPV